MTDTINSSQTKVVDEDFPIWLLGDSPSNSPSAKDQNLTPLDPRHPTRHSIWTPICDVIQRHLFIKYKLRLDDSKLFIRNAVSKSTYKEEGNKEFEKQIDEFGKMMIKHNPFLVLCFGQFAYEFALRAQKMPSQNWKLWIIPKLSKKFDERIKEGQLGRVTLLLPLLHASAARSFQSATTHFSGGRPNYFEYVGGKIANVLIDSIENHTDDRLDNIWLPTN
ncbi:MAG: hypothetical protein ABR907_10755 [Terracidiphilus sp.]|jgi:hypothetical protein